jgi:phosphatidylserine/phosphatidylglycerophosphate/cardiolipin synthase-like enzyme
VDWLLDSLTPLAALLARTADPSAACAALTAALGSGSAAPTEETLRRCFGADARAASDALATAGITLGATAWATRLAQAEILALEMQRSRPLAPRLAMTIPAFLRPAWTEHLRETPAADWPRETWPAILDLTSQAARELLLAAPFLSEEHASALAASVTRLTRAGGHVLLVTQAAGTGRNLPPVRLLRKAAQRPGRIDVWSWAGPGLGIHFKAVIADRQHGYLGSANLTTHAAIRQAEAGVILHGPMARQLDQWIRTIATRPWEQAPET